MIRSLQNQIFFVLIILVSVLLVQILLSHTIQSSLLNNQTIINQSHEHVALAYELERDVIDLQRNLLIYKETASEISVSRFYELMNSVKLRLDKFQLAVKNTSSNTTHTDIIKRMRDHLNDYNDNFSSVIDGRSRRNTIIKDQIEPAYLSLKKNIEYLIIDTKNNTARTEVNEIKYHIALSEKLINQYLNSPDQEHVNHFKIEIASIYALSKKIQWQKESPDKLLKKLKKDFFKLTQTTRGYIFLVNVVMTGSANEFLYLTRHLREIVSKTQKEMTTQANTQSAASQINSNIVSVSSILIALLTGWFLSRRIIQPIRIITDVFAALSKGKTITDIPGIQRTDEIGDLAKAANVFHSKNKQTSDLLLTTQKMNSEQEALNKELAKEKNNAEQAAKSKSMFLANMSHEIRTPMNGIIGLIDLSLKTNKTEKQKKFLEKAAFSSQILMKVINDILDFSKIEAGKMDIESVEFHLDSIIDNLISAMSVTLKEKHINFRISTSSTVPEHLYGDPLRISQVLLNICNNALKFTDEGLVHVYFNFKQLNNEQFLLVDIEDTGIGMSQQETDNVFTSFTQADGSTSRKYGGTGLGLTIVRQLTELMGGEVSVTSKKNHGSCFKVSFKVKSASEEKAINKIENNNIDISYLPLNNAPLIEDITLNSFHKEINTIQWNDLENKFNDDNTDKTIVIDIPDINYLNKHKEHIISLQKKNATIAFITDIQPQGFSNKISEDWNIAVLHHPFSPATFNHFFSQLLNTEYKSENIKSTHTESEPQYKGHILLVEDNHVNQIVAGQMLKNYGLTFEIAENGQLAVDMIYDNKKYDLVLMDIQMPVMDGFEATRLLRDKGYEDLIICGLSANAMKKDLEQAETVGMNGYLTKPIEANDMLTIFNKFLVKVHD